MCEQVKIIGEYYINLDYNRRTKKKALMKISSLSKRIEVKNDENIVERFFETVSMIKQNLSLFQSACDHVDVVNVITEYLNFFGQKYISRYIPGEPDIKKNIFFAIVYTLFNICAKEVQLFLETAIFKNFVDPLEHEDIKKIISCQTNEMIVLDDSDLYAVIRQLMIIENSHLNKILVQEPIIREFLSLVKKYVTHTSFYIQSFRSKQELLTFGTPYHLNVVSIWSEDVIAAKNLGISLNRDIIFINTYMGFYGGIILLPYTQLFYNAILQYHCLYEDKCTISTEKSTNIKEPNVDYSICNIFYDGMWQEPVEKNYQMINGIVQANATMYDVSRCFKSAEKGHKIWSTWSTNNRIQVLTKLAMVLECHGKFGLSNVILHWLKFPYLQEKSIYHFQKGILEVTRGLKPRGIIFLHIKDEITLFRVLTQTLIAGNSAIVLCNEDSYNLGPYCDMFSTSGIPPGVINILSMRDINLPAINFTELTPIDTFLTVTSTKDIILLLQ